MCSDCCVSVLVELRLLNFECWWDPYTSYTTSCWRHHFCPPSVSETTKLVVEKLTTKSVIAAMPCRHGPLDPLTLLTAIWAARGKHVLFFKGVGLGWRWCNYDHVQVANAIHATLMTSSTHLLNLEVSNLQRPRKDAKNNDGVMTIPRIQFLAMHFNDL